MGIDAVVLNSFDTFKPDESQHLVQSFARCKSPGQGFSNQNLERNFIFNPRDNQIQVIWNHTQVSAGIYRLFYVTDKVSMDFRLIFQV